MKEVWRENAEYKKSKENNISEDDDKSNWSMAKFVFHLKT